MRKQPRLLESAPFALRPPTICFSFSLLHLPATVSLLGFPSLQGSQGRHGLLSTIHRSRCGAWRIFEPEHFRPTVEKLKCRLARDQLPPVIRVRNNVKSNFHKSFTNFSQSRKGPRSSNRSDKNHSAECQHAHCGTSSA